MKKRSKEVRLAAGEIEILEILWRGNGVTISQAHEAIDRKVGYTTVQTRLSRLVEKGLVKRSGLHPAMYEALIQPEDVTRKDLDSLLKHVTFGQVVPLVAHLVKDRKLSIDEIRELKDLIEEAEQSQRQQKSKGGRHE